MWTMRIAIVVLAVLGFAAEQALAQGRGGGGRGGGGGSAAHPGGGHAPGGARAPGAAHHHGGHRHGGYRPGGARYPYYPFWGGLGVGIGLGWAGPYYGGWPGYGYYHYAPPVHTGYTVTTNSGWTVSTAPSAEPAPAPAPDLIFYPRNGQGDGKKESDLRECNRWATTQAAAMADANIFMRAVLACMDGRGYTGR